MKFYIFIVLPFGLTSCPKIFTKILKPVNAFFSEIGIIIIIMNKTLEDRARQAIIQT